MGMGLSICKTIVTAHGGEIGAGNNPEGGALINNLLAKLLHGGGYQVLQSYSGAEAISLASSHCPDLVLLDLGLPDMDGISVMEDLTR